MKSVNIAVDGKYAEESAQEMIEDLREVLEKLGITVEITEGFHDTKYLSFRYDVDEIRKRPGEMLEPSIKLVKKRCLWQKPRSVWKRVKMLPFWRKRWELAEALFIGGIRSL